MKFKSLSVLSLLVLMVALALVGTPAYAQQTVDPSGACTTYNPLLVVVGQTGYFTCYQSALGSSSGTWTKVLVGENTVSFTVAFNEATLAGTAGLTATVPVLTLPAGATVISARITNTTTWAGAATLTVSLGDATSATEYTAAINLKTTASNTTFVNTAAPVFVTEANPGDAIGLYFTATTNNLSTLTAGALKVTLTYVLPPPGPTVIP